MAILSGSRAAERADHQGFKMACNVHSAHPSSKALRSKASLPIWRPILFLQDSSEYSELSR